MRFQDFIDSGKARRARPDIQLARSLIKMSDSLLETLAGIPCTPQSAPTIMTNFYEALREIVEAMAVKDGYKVYSHEAFTFYLRELGETTIAEKFDRFRRIRNGINYYGKPIDAPSAQAYSGDIRRTIEELKKRRLRGVLPPSA
ncbi:MAG: hypothetical protein HY369_03495 [Candidatus Aenigmarchaeota archaeon]|nr:hypothetical protein [Candidatus Aenigmarchaeota archaeon]